MNADRLRTELNKLGYPADQDVRQSAVWFPFLREPSYEDSDMLNCSSFLIHKNGHPKVVLVPLELRNMYMKLALDSSVFTQPPPLFMTYDPEGKLYAQRFEGDTYEPAKTIPTWEDLDSYSPGRFSEDRADNEIMAVKASIGSWLQSRYSSAAVNRLMSIHVQRAAIVKELIQNACDCLATELQFGFDGDTLVFRHDGHPFMPANVHAITALNLSCKPPGAIGYKGIGFKAVYQVCRRPQISSGPFRFAFEPRPEDASASKRGVLCPYLPVVDHSIPRAPEHWTEFFLPLEIGQKETIEKSLHEIESTLLLFVVSKRLPLRRMVLPTHSIEIPPLETVASGTVTVLSNGTPTYWFCTRHHFQISDDHESAVQDFANSTLREDFKLPLEEEIVVAVPLRSNENSVLIPDTENRGYFHSFMPTQDSYPYPWHINGNFLVDEQRDHLRIPSKGSWNAMLLEECGRALLVFLDEARKTWQKDPTLPIPEYYNLMPEWSQLCEEARLGSHFSIVRNSYYRHFCDEPRVPVIFGNHQSFVAPDQAIWIDRVLLPLFSQDTWAGFVPGGKKLVIPGLNEEIWGEFLSQITEGVIVFSSDSLIQKLSERNWPSLVPIELSSSDFIPLISRICCYLGMLGISKSEVENVWLLLTAERELYRPNDRPLGNPVCRILEDEFSALPKYVNREIKIVHDGIIRFLQHDPTYFRGTFSRELDDAMREKGRRLWLNLVETLDLSSIITNWLNPCFEEKGDDEEATFDKKVDWLNFLFQNRDRLHRRGLCKELNIRLLACCDGEELWKKPWEMWLFGACPQGRDVEQFIGNTSGVAILSSKCKELLRDSEKVDDAEIGLFFSRLGVQNSIRGISKALGFWDPSEKKEFSEALGITLEQMPYGDINYSMPIRDFVFHHDIRSVFYNTLSVGNYRRRSLRIQSFARLLECSWGQELKDKCKKLGSYHIRGAWENGTIMGSDSELATILRETEWVPLANDPSVLKLPRETCLPTEENIQLADLKTVSDYADILLDNQDLIDFLGFGSLPSEITSLDAIRSFANNWATEQDPKGRFENLYSKLALELGSKVSLETGRNVFIGERLIFVPTRPPVLRNSGEVLYGADSRFDGFLEDLKEFYPETLRILFSKLGVADKVQEIHYLRYLVSYIWKEQPTINESRRQLILKTYRRLVGWAKTNPIGQGIWGSPEGKEFSAVQLFYGNCAGVSGWYSGKEKTIIYRDEPQIEAILAKNGKYVLESFLAQLRRTEEGLDPFLQMFGVQAASRLATRKILTGDDVRLLSSSSNLRQNLFRLTDTLQREIRRIVDEEFRDDAQAAMFFDRVGDLAKASLTAELYSCGNLAVTYPEIVATEDEPASCDAAFSLSDSMAALYLVGEVCSLVGAQIARELKQLLRTDTLPEQPRIIADRVVEDVSGTLDTSPDHFESRLQRVLARHFPLYTSTRAELEALSPEGYQQQELVVDSSGDTGVDQSGLPEREAQEGAGSPEPTGQRPVVMPDISSQEVKLVTRRLEDFEVYPKNISKPPSRARRPTRAIRRLTDEQRRQIGRQAELLVYRAEIERMNEVGKPELAKKVIDRNAEGYDPNGPYDIDSYYQDENGQWKPMMIEIKGHLDPDVYWFDMSEPEMRMALSGTSVPYYVYLVLNLAQKEAQIHPIDFRILWQHQRLYYQARTLRVAFKIREETDV